MTKYKSRKLPITEVIPVLNAEERARRIEIFIDTMAKAAEVKGYHGCKYFAEQGHGEIYIVSAKSKGTVF